MNEIKHIHLGRQSFTISVEAYKELHEYLNAIKAQVGDKGSDVVEEVELRMAELLEEHGIDGEKVILPKDVAFLREQLGEPHDFKDDDEAPDGTTSEHETSSPGSVRRLFRDTDQAMVAGVSAGLGAYFGIDAVIPRLLFVVLTFFGGTGILLYILLWLIVPEARTSSERLQMRGKAVTVDTLKEVIDRADIPGAAERVGRTGRQMGHGVGRRIARIAEMFGKVILAVIGSALVVAASGMFVGATIVGTYSLMHGLQIGNEVVFPVGTEAVAGLFCALAVLFVLAFLLMVAGLTMIRRKAVIRGWVAAAAVGLFLVAGGLGTAFGFDIAPGIRDQYRAMSHTQTIALQPFTKANLTGKDVNYIFMPSSKYSVDVEYFGNNSTVNDIKPQVKDGVLTMDTSSYKSSSTSCSIFCLYSDDWLTVTIHAPNLQAAEIEGENANLNLNGSDLSPASFTLTVGKNSQATINNAGSTMATVDVARADGLEQVTLQGISNFAQDDFVSIAENIVNLQETGTIAVNTNNNTCGSDNQLVYLNQNPGGLSVNGNKVDPATRDNLSKLWSETGTNAYNCVSVQ